MTHKSILVAHQLRHFPSETHDHKLAEILDYLFGFNPQKKLSKKLVGQYLLIIRLFLSFKFPNAKCQFTTLVLDSATKTKITESVDQWLTPSQIQSFKNLKPPKESKETDSALANQTLNKHQARQKRWDQIIQFTGTTGKLSPLMFRRLKPPNLNQLLKKWTKKPPKKRKPKHMPPREVIPPPKKNRHIYPDTPPHGWMGIVVGTSFIKNITFLDDFVENDVIIQIRSHEPANQTSQTKQYCLCLGIRKKNKYIIQGTVNFLVFRSNITSFHYLKLPFQNIVDIVGAYKKKSICLRFDGEKIMISDLEAYSSLVFDIDVTTQPVTEPHKPKTIHGVAKLNTEAHLLKPLATLKNHKNTHFTLTAQVSSKHLFITITTIFTTKNKRIIRGKRQFMAELDHTRVNSPQVYLPVSLFHINTSYMYHGQFIPTPSKTILEHHYHAEKLKTIFDQTFNIQLFRIFLNKITDSRRICLVMTKENMLLWTINEYRGCIQAAQLPIK